MRVAYVTVHDARDVDAWSGTAFHMARALEQAGLEVERVGGLRQRLRGPLRLKEELYRRVGGRVFDPERTALVSNHYARQVERALAELGVDAVLSPSAVAMARLRTERPIVLWTDATFAGLVALPGEETCRESLRYGNRIEQEALSRCRFAVYASAWAADSARRSYTVDPRKVRVVPFGANLERSPGRGEVERLLKERSVDSCTLLFVGRNWAGKGGPIAVETAALLNRRGLATELHVVGCEPPGRPPPFVRVHGFLSKATPEGRETLSRLLGRAHFLILPTRVECFGIVLAEASSHGVPSLAADVGGTSSAVRDGRNGKLFALEEGAEAYARQVEWLLASRERYRALARSAYEEYAARLNWATAGAGIRDHLMESCSAAA